MHDQSWSYTCAKGLWKLPAAQVLWMIRTCRSWITPEHERAISRKLKKNSLQKSLGFPRSLNVLSLLAFLWLWCIMDQVMMVHYVIKIVGWSWVRCKNCPFVRTPHSDSCQLSPDRILKGRPTDFFYFVIWCWCFVSLSQERDECSEEITRTRALQEKYEAEMSQLAKDSQAASSFTWEQ